MRRILTAVAVVGLVLIADPVPSWAAGEETLFGATSPASTNLSDGSPGLTLGTRLRFTVDGTIVGLRWRCPDTVPSASVPWFVVRYMPGTDDPSGSLASGTFTSLTAGAYNVASFAPVAVVAGDEIVADIWTPDRYVVTPHFFDSAVTSGDVVGPADDVVSSPVRHNGRLHAGGSAQFPQDGFNASAYFVDVLFIPGTSPTASPTPVPTGSTMPGLASSEVPLPDLSVGFVGLLVLLSMIGTAVAYLRRGADATSAGGSSDDG